MAKSKNSSKKDAKPAAIKDKSKAEFDKDSYTSYLNGIGECMKQEKEYNISKNQKLNPNRQKRAPIILAKFIHEDIDDKTFSDEHIKKILEKEGPEGLAKKAYNTLETYLYNANETVQKDMLPEFKKNIEYAENTGAAYTALNLIAKNLELTLDEKKISDEGLKNFVIVSNAKDTKSAEYKAALDKLVEAYIKDTVDNSNISDKAKKSRKFRLKLYYKEMGSLAADTATSYYAQNNEDKIKKLNTEYADKLLAYKDNKKKLEAVMGYENLYAQLTQPQPRQGQ